MGDFQIEDACELMGNWKEITKASLVLMIDLKCQWKCSKSSMA